MAPCWWHRAVPKPPAAPRHHRNRARHGGGPGACILAGCEWSCLLICRRAKNNSQPCIQSCEKSPIARRRVTGRQPSLGDGGCCGDGALRTAVQPWHPWSPPQVVAQRCPVPPARAKGGGDGSPAKATVGHWSQWDMLGAVEPGGAVPPLGGHTGGQPHLRPLHQGVPLLRVSSVGCDTSGHQNVPRICGHSSSSSSVSVNGAVPGHCTWTRGQKGSPASVAGSGLTPVTTLGCPGLIRPPGPGDSPPGDTPVGTGQRKDPQVLTGATGIKMCGLGMRPHSHMSPVTAPSPAVVTHWTGWG